MRLQDDVGNAIRSCIYEEYERLQKENPHYYKGDIIQLMYQSFLSLAEEDYDTFLERVGILTFDYYVKYKGRTAEGLYPYIDLIELCDDVVCFADRILDSEESPFFIMMDCVINSYEEPSLLDDFVEFIISYPALGKHFAEVYHPDGEAMLIEYQKYQKKSSFISHFIAYDSLDLSSLYLSYHVLALSFDDYEEAMDQLCLKIDHYKEFYPEKRKIVIQQLLGFYYSCQKEREILQQDLSTVDLDLLSLCEEEPVDRIYTFLDDDFHISYVNRIIEVFVSNYQGIDVLVSKEETIQNVIEEFSRKLKDDKSELVEAYSWFDFVNGYIYSLYHRYMQESDSIPSAEDAVDQIVQRLISLFEGTDQAKMTQKVVQVLALHYYHYYFKDSHDPIVQAMETLSKEEFLKMVFDQETRLFQLVENQLENDSLHSTFPYELMEEVLSSSYGKELYLRYHPDFQSEYQCYLDWKAAEKLRSQFLELSIQNFTDFYLFFRYFQTLGGSSYEAVQILSDKLEDLGKINLVQQREVMTSIVTTYYVLFKHRLMEEEVQNEESGLLEDHKNLILDLEEKSQNDIISLLQQDEKARKLVLEGWLQDFDIMTYFGVQEQVEFHQKKFVRKFSPPSKEQ